MFASILLRLLKIVVCFYHVKTTYTFGLSYFVQFSKVYVVTSQQLLYHIKSQIRCQHFFKKVSKFFLREAVDCFATTSLVYQVVCYLSTTFFLINQVFLKPDLLFYCCRLALVTRALRQDIIYQFSMHWSTKIRTFFDFFFITDCFYPASLYCSFLTQINRFLCIEFNFYSYILNFT